MANACQKIGLNIDQSHNAKNWCIMADFKILTAIVQKVGSMWLEFCKALVRCYQIFSYLDHLSNFWDICHYTPPACCYATRTYEVHLYLLKVLIVVHERYVNAMICCPQGEYPICGRR